MIPSNTKPPVDTGEDDGSIEVPDLPVPTPTPSATTCPPPTAKATGFPTNAHSSTTRPAPPRPAQANGLPKETAKTDSTSGSAAPAVSTPGATSATLTASTTSAAEAPRSVGDVTVTAVHPAIVIGLVLVWILALVRLGCSWRGRVKRRRDEAALQQYATAASLRVQGRRHLRSVD